MYKVLVVDDEKVICENIKSKLYRLKDDEIKDVFIALNGKDAEKIFESKKPEIVITDINMAGISGLELIRRIQIKNIPTNCIVLSGYDDYNYVRNAFKLGVVDYLLKPISINDLREKIYMIKHKSRQNSYYIDNISEECKQHLTTKQDKTAIDIALRYIKDNYAKGITMLDVSNIVYMSYAYFSKVFKENTGMNFTNYLLKIRMEEAKRLLQNPLNRINEVAEMVGYENACHFSRAFKKFFGYSPTQYRINSIHNNESRRYCSKSID